MMGVYIAMNTVHENTLSFYHDNKNYVVVVVVLGISSIVVG